MEERKGVYQDFYQQLLKFGDRLSTVLEKMSKARLLVDELASRSELSHLLSSLANFTTYISFSGVMKAGKTTCVCALIGRDILPTRNNPMTTLPTIILHVPNQEEPILDLTEPLALELRKMLAEIRKLDLTQLQLGEESAALISDHSWNITRFSEGSEKVRTTLYVVNDLLRIHMKQSNRHHIRPQGSSSLLE